jgi:hypothetical protein
MPVRPVGLSRRFTAAVESCSVSRKHVFTRMNVRVLGRNGAAVTSLERQMIATELV